MSGDTPFSLIHIRLTVLDFSMPSLNSVFPFLEAIRPEADLTWHIRRGRLLNCYESAWASFITMDHTASITFYDEPDFENLRSSQRYYLLCLVPRAWNDAGLRDNLRQTCFRCGSLEVPGYIVKRPDFFQKGE